MAFGIFKKIINKNNKSAENKKSVVEKKQIGEVVHYYGNIKVAVIKCSQPVSVGDEILFSGATTDFVQKIDSLQLEHEQITTAKKNQAVGLKVKKKVREGDGIYKA